MFVLYFLKQIFKLAMFVIKLLFYYSLIILWRIPQFILFLPFSFVSLLKVFLVLVSSIVLRILFFFYKEFRGFLFYLFRFYVIDAYHQFFYHFAIWRTIKERVFRRYYFYRRTYRLAGNFSAVLRSIWVVEPNALLIKHLVQPLKSTLTRFIRLPQSPTKIGYRFRVIRRLLKFIVSLLTLFYPIQLLIRVLVWYFTVYLLKLLRFLRRRGLMKTKKQTVSFLKIIVLLKLIFVWVDLPFTLIFKPGFSKKYRQYEDMQPDLRVIRSEVWDFALARDCYFDYDDVLNGYYLFHFVRKFSKFFFNFLVIVLAFFYTVIKNFLYILQFVFFSFYIPFKFFYLYSPVIVCILGIKLTFVLLYLIPVLLLLVAILVIYFVYRFCLSRFKNFYLQKSFVFVSFSLMLAYNAFLDRVRLLFFYLVFKIRSLNYLVFSNIRRFVSIHNLFGVKVKSKFNLESFFNPDAFYANLLYYNSSFMFKRIKPYFLRFNNVQFISYFFRIQNISRITPDQIKAFRKIGLNSSYPVYYFEKMFDLEYSKMEMEYEAPYYWSFMRQAYSFNQDILHPKFHVYGFFNFLNFYWNYFSFLSNNSILELDYTRAHDFIQLFNSSASQIFSHLVNDFLYLTKLKKLSFFRNNELGEVMVKLNSENMSTTWYLFHVKYYDKLLRFFWDYFDPPLIKLVFYYYSVLSSPIAIRTYSFLNDYAEGVRHMVSWFIFIFYERVMGKIFINVNKFEDYYDMNFDKSIDRYDFYLSHLRKFFGGLYSNGGSRRRKSTLAFSDHLSENVKKSIRFTEYLDRVAAQRKKDYMDTVSVFFTGSFSFFGHFYVFVRDNVFEFMAVWHDVWRDYVDNSVSRWANVKKVSVFIFYFVKAFILVWFCVFLIITLSSLFFAKSFIIKIVKKIKRLYV